MADTPPRKFMFERSFNGTAAANRVPERKPVTLKPEQYDALKKESYDAGYAAGTKLAIDQHMQQMSGILAQIDKAIAGLIAGMATQRDAQDTATRQMVISIAKKILPDFVARNGLQEIEKILSDSITEMVREPRLVVRVNPQQFDPINNQINEITVQKAYAGKVVVLADEEIAAGDCRIEWADGGLERNTGALMETITAVVTPEDAKASQ